MIDNSSYSKPNLLNIDLKKICVEVKMSKFARFFCDKMSIYNYSRIDDLGKLLGEISNGKYYHIIDGKPIRGKMRVEINNFPVLSPVGGFTRAFLIGLAALSEMTKISDGPIKSQKHCIVRAGSIVSPI